MVSKDAVARADNQPFRLRRCVVLGFDHELVFVEWQSQPLHGVALHGGDVTIAGQIDLVADGSRTWRIVIAFDIADHMIVNDDLAVERPHDEPSIACGHGSHNIVLVGQTVVGEVVTEEAIRTLVGGQPETVPFVDEHPFDHVEAGSQLLHRVGCVAVVEPERMGVGDDELALIVLSDEQSVVGGLEMMFIQRFDVVSLYRIDSVGSQCTECVAHSDQGEHVVFVCQQVIAVIFDDIKPLWSRHIDARCVDIHLAVGCHLVQQGVLHDALEAFGSYLAELSVLFLTVLQKHITCG